MTTKTTRELAGMWAASRSLEVLETIDRLPGPLGKCAMAAEIALILERDGLSDAADRLTTVLAAIGGVRRAS